MQEPENNAAGWGGARKGAGRKKTVKGKYYGFNSTPETEAILESVQGSKTSFINAAILACARSGGVSPSEIIE